MPTETHKLISELLDGETPEAELPRVVERLCAEHTLKTRWSRFILVRECLQGSLPSHLGLNLNDRVARALQDDPVLLAPRKGKQDGASTAGLARRYLKPVAGVAVAASVAAVAILGLRGDEQTPPLNDPALQLSQPALAELAQRPGASVQYADAQLRTPIAQPDARQDRAWLNEYVLRHSETAGFAGRSGFVPYVSIVTTDPSHLQWNQASRPIPVSVPRD